MFDPQDKIRRPFFQRHAQSVVRWFFRMFILLFRTRVDGMERFPRMGPVLVCSNHQSNLDPLILGCAIPRPVNYLAKKQLFSFGPLGWFFGWNDVIALDRDSGLGGIKETLKRLKRKELIIMFPEGTRSLDGEMRKVKSGFCVLVRKSKVPIMPVAIAGAFEALPRKSLLPNFSATLQVSFGEAIQPEEYGDLSEEELTSLVEEKIKECFAKARLLHGRCHESRHSLRESSAL